jgi:hypothetical protein
VILAPVRDRFNCLMSATSVSAAMVWPLVSPRMEALLRFHR